MEGGVGVIERFRGVVFGGDGDGDDARDGVFGIGGDVGKSIAAEEISGGGVGESPVRVDGGGAVGWGRIQPGGEGVSFNVRIVGEERGEGQG